MHALLESSDGGNSAQNHLYRLLAQTSPRADPGPLLDAMAVATPGVAAHLRRTYAGAGLTAALLRWYIY